MFDTNFHHESTDFWYVFDRLSFSGEECVQFLSIPVIAVSKTGKTRKDSESNKDPIPANQLALYTL